MSAIPRPDKAIRTPPVPFLVNGQRMTQPEFHRRYEACPPSEKWELIGGIVFMASPLRYPHGNYDFLLGTALGVYVVGTPGVDGAHNATSILDEASEPQPDLILRLLRQYGGNSWVNEDKYLEGPPEFVAEIAYSSLDIDLHRKRDDYERAGVIEYLVLSIEERRLLWFNFASGKAITANRKGILRSRVFPGLWIDGEALLAGDSPRLMEAVQRGLASLDHERFLRRLEAHRRRHSKE